ncbi:MAG TPA: glycosyltransferase [Pyrinomonadaceae bacterium]|nr:glycosyltransferase [Pyrinomonadaceae bacterium]
MKAAVLQLIDSFNQGGSERQALQLTRLLVQSGKFKIHLASLSPEGSLRSTIEDLDLGDIPSFPLNSFYDANAVKQLTRFVQWLKAARINVLHTHDFYTNVFGTTAGALARLPVRVASMRETAGMRTSTQKRVQRVAYSLAHHVVANSQAVRQVLIADGVPAEKVSVIYNGLDLKRLAPQTFSRAETLGLLGLDSETDPPRRFISIVANMRHEVKDHRMFLRAARRVAEVVPDAAFLLAGEGELTDSLRELAAELGIHERTYFLGRCERVAELLSVSEICVLSSKAEGFSNSILEYMAAGRPVVATNVGGAAELIREGETGYLVPAGDDEMMAARLIDLLRDPNRSRMMGEAGKRIVEEQFSCEAQLSRTEDLYERLLRQT